MLQRQIMFKQLEELQRQKKLQELNDPRQQNVINQHSLLRNKQASGAQYAPLINGTPVRDGSQMFMFGNTNLVHGFQNGLPYSQVPSQPVDGTSISNPSFSRFSHFQGATRESIGEQVDTISRSSMSDQFNVSYQEKNMVGPNDQQEFGRGQEQGDFATLDPLEQKFLFNTDDDSLVGGFGNMFEDTDNSQAFPSLQSGSWSALMQSALEETSSTDTGVQEEWSGLSFQNPDLSNDNQPSNLMESGKHPTSWQNSIFQNVPSLKTSNASSSFPGFQPLQLRSDSSHESTQQSHKEAGESEASAQVQRFSPLQVHSGPSGHAGEFEFVNDAPNKSKEFKKGFLPDNQRHSYRSADFPAPDSNAQTSNHMLELLHKVDKFKEYRHGTPSAYVDSAPTSEMPKAETADAFTPSINASIPQYFGLRLAPPTQKKPMNYYDVSQISQQPDTSHFVLLKDQDGQRSSRIGQQVSNSISQPNVWVDIPSQHNLSTSDVANSRMETASEDPKESDSKLYVKGDINILEASGHVLNSQNLDHGKGQEGKILFETVSFSGRAEANASIRATIKKERADSDTKVPQQTSMSHLTSTYENYKTLLVPSAAREDQMVKNSSHHPLQDASQLLHRNNSFVQMNLASTSQYGSIRPLTETNPFPVNQLSSPYLNHLNVPNQDLIVSQSKKRKFRTYELLPWHKEATKGSSRLQDTRDTSIAELEWAQAAKRVPEKLKEETEALGDSHSMVHPKKRIILTTQLMQVLFRPAPAAILSDDATACDNTVTYFAARLALGDACSLTNHSSSGKNVISPGSSDQNLSKVVQDFIDRVKKLEDELLRLENGGSILEIRMESQDLERFSVINRFAKFHSRVQMVAAEIGSSGGGSTVPKLFPQRYVTASPMPRIVPEGHNCLSL